MAARSCRALGVVALLLLLITARPARAQVEDAPLRVDQCQAIDGEESAAEDKKSALTQKAGDFYDRGLVLYEEGDYKGAVQAFIDSYCAKPHPSAFYNIAQSYERLLEFERSVRYFERYVAEAGPDAPNTRKATLRAEVLRNLPAQVRIATVPAGASVSIRNQAGITARGSANGESPLEVRQGSYTMHVEMPGYKSVQRELITKPGQPYSYYLRLEAETAQLEVTASPSHGRIFLDDRLVGVGNYNGTLPVGRYEITVEAKSREASTQMVELTSGQRFSTSIALERPQASGRRTLVIGSSLVLGVAGGTAVSQIFEQGSLLTGIGSLATAGLGFAGSYYGIPESTTRGDAWFILGSSFVGLMEGSLIGAFLGCSLDDETTQNEECNGNVVTGSALTGAMAGAVTSALTHKRLQLSTGDVALLGSGAFWGISSGALLYAVFDSDKRVRDPMLLAGLNLGLISAAGLITNSEISLPRVAIIDLSGVGGVLAGVSVAQAFDSGPERLQHFAIFGMVTGLVAGTFLTRFMDDEKSATDETGIEPVLSSATDARGHQLMQLGLSARF